MWISYPKVGNYKLSESSSENSTMNVNGLITSNFERLWTSMYNFTIHGQFSENSTEYGISIAITTKKIISTQIHKRI